jgi:membrane-bound lytic murein transglycosylase D
MKKYLVILVCFFTSAAQAQQILVPDNIYFADIHLSIDKSAREKIQKNVDYLLKYPTYFQQKVERADTYFPIIEREFKLAGLPTDFKYLAIQESGLVSNAVSTSKAEGFWQFKRETATDFGLTVNPDVDERRHIIEASRGAAKYFVQSNAYYKNWVNTMVSYYMGFTGAKAYARPGDADSKDMLITDKTHVYFLTFLAHKIAFENYVGKTQKPAISLRELRATPGQSLGEIALANQMDPVELQKYNSWLLGGTIPADKDYTVLIPVTNATASTMVIASNTEELAPTILINKTITPDEKAAEFGSMNGLKVIIAQAGDTKDKLALQARMSTKKFLKLNDMYSFEQIVPGKVYYLEKKKSRAHAEYHTVQNGESLFDIAQMYGMRMKAIVSKNRMKKNESIVSGRLLWLQKTRPANIAVEYRKVDADPVTPKTPQPLQAEVIATSAQPGSEALAEIKDVAANTLQKAGHVLNIPEKQPEVAKVSTEVFEETIELNPKPETDTENTKEETAFLDKTDSELSKINAGNTPVLTENTTEKPVSSSQAPESVLASVSAPEIVSEPAAASVTTPEPVQAPETNPVALYPKTVSKTPEKVMEPVEAPTQEKPAPVAEAPKVVLRDPVTEPVKKTVPVPVKKAAPIVTAAIPAKPATHTVAKGETLYSISRKYNVSPSDLKHWNELGEKPLAIGQELKVTGEKQAALPVLTVTGPDKPVADGTVVNITHKVGEGESMYQISRKYGVSIKEIMEWNNKNDFNVSAGDELTIRSRPGSSRN